MIHAIIAVLTGIAGWAFWRQHKQPDVPLDRWLKSFILRKYK